MLTSTLPRILILAFSLDDWVVNTKYNCDGIILTLQDNCWHALENNSVIMRISCKQITPRLGDTNVMPKKTSLFGMAKNYFQMSSQDKTQIHKDSL